MYNPDGIRTARHFNGITTEYLVDSNRPYAQVVQESTGTAQRFYTYGLDLINQEQVNTNDTNNTASNAVSYYLYDALGSTRALTDENGNVTDEYSYSAYGDLLTQTGDTENHYLHTGEQYDPYLDQYYLRARYRDGSVFTQMDTYQGRMGEPVTLHKYLYANVDPVNYTDPTGFYATNLAETSYANNIAARLQTATVSRVGVGQVAANDAVYITGTALRSKQFKERIW